MKRVFLLVFFFIALKSEAQVIELGLRDNRFARIGYITTKDFYFGVEQSLLNVKVKEQNGRLYGGYSINKQFWNADLSIYGGTEYNGNWQIIGGYLRGGFSYNSINLTGIINPNYDTGLDFQLNYNVVLGYSIIGKKDDGNQRVSVNVSYGNIPEFRDNVNNLRIGVKFISYNLCVQPEIAIPGINKDNTHIRVLCNFYWRFKF